MNKKIKILVFAMFFLFIIMPLVNSAPPQETSTGLLVSINIPTAVELNKNLTIYASASDSDSGLAVTDADCDLIIHNEEGERLVNIMDVVASSGYLYEFSIDKKNFSESGTRDIFVYCNNSLKGGKNTFDFIINEYGEELTTPLAFSFNMAMVYMMVLFVLSLLGIFYFDEVTGKIACYWVAHVLFVVGSFSVWQFDKGYALSYTGLAGVFKVLFYTSIIAVFPMLILTLAWIFYYHVMSEEIKGFMDRGMDEGEAFSRAKSRREWKW